MTAIPIRHSGISPAAVQGTPLLGQPKRRAEWLERKEGAKHILSVPVFAVGTHKGIPYAEADLAEMVRAYVPTLHQVKPVLKLGHDDAQGFARLTSLGTDPRETSLGLPNLGFPDNLRVNEKSFTDPDTGRTWGPGQLLIADYVNLPPQVHEDIVNHRYLERSAEIIRNYQDKERPGVVWPRVLRAVSLLGDELPAVRGMPSRVELNAEAPDALDVVLFSQGVLPMGMGVPAGAAGASVDEKLDKLLAAVAELVTLQKAKAVEAPAADMAAAIPPEKKPDAMAAPVMAPATAAPMAAAAEQDKPGTVVQIHSEVIDKKLGELAEIERRLLRREAESLLRDDQAKAEKFAEGLCTPTNFRIPIELKPAVARLYAAASDVQKFSDGAGGQKSLREQFAELCQKLPLIARAEEFDDRGRDLRPQGESKIASEVHKMAEKDAVEKGIPLGRALLERVDRMSDEEFMAFHNEAYAAGRNGAGRRE